MSTNLNSLKVGPEMIIRDRFRLDNIQIIKRLTKNSEELSIKIEKACEKRKLINILKNENWDKYSLSSLATIIMSLLTKEKE